MSQENLELVRSIYADWERGDYSSAEWAHPEIEYVIADGPTPGSWTGLAGLAEGFRSILDAWEGYGGEVDDYRELDWPTDYWPKRDAEATPDQFRATIAGFLEDRAALRAMLTDPDTDLFAIIPGTPGHTILREIRVDADHNAYHVGEFAVLREVMGTWPANRRG